MSQKRDMGHPAFWLVRLGPPAAPLGTRNWGIGNRAAGWDSCSPMSQKRDMGHPAFWLVRLGPPANGLSAYASYSDLKEMGAYYNDCMAGKN